MRSSASRLQPWPHITDSIAAIRRMSASAVTRRSVTPAGRTGSCSEEVALPGDEPVELGAAHAEGARAADQAPESADDPQQRSVTGRGPHNRPFAKNPRSQCV
ncbi:hypothetical protein GCM10022233_55070 [Streptomyces shaanxiensis]|uniref:Uncharacterized protein n=1 Tax=Streptomyces shaanxiensis TaxID=653357 RepID=A0ABP7VPI5_9ACTN